MGFWGDPAKLHQTDVFSPIYTITTQDTKNLIVTFETQPTSLTSPNFTKIPTVPKNERSHEWRGHLFPLVLVLKHPESENNERKYEFCPLFSRGFSLTGDLLQRLQG